VEQIGGQPVEPHFVKLHYPRRLSRFTRRLRLPIISVQLWVAEELTAAGLPVLPEVAGGVLGADPAEAWGFLIREARPRGSGAAAARFAVPLVALSGQDVRQPGDPPLMAQLAARSGEDPGAWLAERVVVPMVRLWLHAVSATGCVPEPHGQNTLFAFDPDGRRTAILYRDCGIYVDPATRAELGMTRALPPVNVISRDVRQPREHVF